CYGRCCSLRCCFLRSTTEAEKTAAEGAATIVAEAGTRMNLATLRSCRRCRYRCFGHGPRCRQDRRAHRRYDRSPVVAHRAANQGWRELAAPRRSELAETAQ